MSIRNRSSYSKWPIATWRGTLLITVSFARLRILGSSASVQRASSRHLYSVLQDRCVSFPVFKIV
eukprot:6181355-Pleurochrysis_carterae.AAC.2